MILRPAVITFVDVVTRAGKMTVDLEEVTIEKESFLNSCSLAEARIPEQTGLIVIAVKKVDGEIVFNPGSQYILSESENLIVMGHEDQVDKLRILAAASKSL